MIRIRYCDLPAGLHIRIEDQGARTTVWLLPGLTPAQRQAAIRRAKGAALVGQGPELPQAALVRALAVDGLRAIVRNGLRAMRLHPAVFFPPLIVLMSAAVAYLLLVSVSIQFLPGTHPEAVPRGPSRSVPLVHPAAPRPHRSSAPTVRQPAQTAPAGPPPAAPSPSPTHSPSPSPKASPTPTPTSASPSPTLPIPVPSTSPPSPSPSASSPLPTKPSPIPTKSF